MLKEPSDKKKVEKKEATVYDKKKVEKRPIPIKPPESIDSDTLIIGFAYPEINNASKPHKQYVNLPSNGKNEGVELTIKVKTKDIKANTTGKRVYWRVTAGDKNSKRNTLGDFFFDLKERIPELVFQEDEIEVGVLLFDKKSNSLKITLSENSDKKTTIDTDKIPIGNFEFLKKYQVEENNLVPESMELSCNRELYSLNNHENIDFAIRFNFGTNQMYDLLHPIKIDTDNIVNSTMTEKIIRIYLVFIGYDVTGPWVSMLDIPVQEGNVDVYKGIAIFNLSNVVPLIPQRYVAWAFTKNCMAGPLNFFSVAE